MIVRELTRHDDARWNQLVSESPQGNAFTRAECLQMLCDTDPDLQLLRVGCFDDTRLAGGQAAIYHTRWGLTLTPPFEFFYNGPLLAPMLRMQRASHTPMQLDVLRAIAQTIAERIPVVSFETHRSLSDARALIELGWAVRPEYSHVWDVRNPERVWSEMNRDKRRAIKQANAQFTFGHDESDDTLDAFLPLYHQTMEKFSWRPSPKWEAIFRARLRWLAERDQCRLYTARTASGELVGGVVTLLSREDQTAYLHRQGSSIAFREAGGVPALYWHVAQQVANDFNWVDFGGSPQPSLGRFKDFLGAEATLHFQVTHCNNPRRWQAYTLAQIFKDRTYNLLMRFARRPIQFILHKKYVH